MKYKKVTSRKLNTPIFNLIGYAALGSTGTLCLNSVGSIYHLKKDTQTETWSIYDDILDLRVPSGCRLLAIYEINQR